ncbi:ATP-dependent DNA helicase [Carnobacterium divergens]|uniref:ATP-dependent DNA helicase n=1 Tax=Carnobacterium divergens TaxID=2748 RepID=UPI0028927518|nr:ATP-dependent DNA helicase [Carnobacterium divergens]MDT2012062.1 ATP-dependent DNA helicase [Carnobacterium divergens]
MNQNNRLSVRKLVEFVLKKGSIDERYTGSAHTAIEGTKLHQKIQKEAGDNYQKEVFLKKELLINQRNYSIEGRADGVVEEKSGKYWVDEIKTSEIDFDLLPDNTLERFWGQLMCYGYMLAVEKELAEIELQLTYYETLNEKITRTRKKVSITELTSFFNHLVEQYEKWVIFNDNWRILRNQTLKQLDFPYGDYRSGQRELAVAVYKTILTEQNLYCEAPTGIGKTMSTLFPAVKSIGEEKAEKLFYLTAKTITRQVAEDAVEQMERNGAKLKSVTLTAKDKICFLDERKCDPEHCIFARGYYDRLNEALFELLQQENNFTREIVESYARKYTLCPFELSLDISLWCDIIICDYNYLFDPIVYLKRFFNDEKNEYVFLIDEVHNLVDRSREMFSASLSEQKIITIYRELLKEDQKQRRVMNRLIKDFKSFRTNCGEVEFMTQSEPADLFLKHVVKFTENTKEWLLVNQQASSHSKMLELYFEALTYLKISEFYDERYVTYVHLVGKDVTIKQFCLNPSFLINQTLKRGKASVLFSATLSPINYFAQLLGGKEKPLMYQLPSPFKKEHQLLVIANYIDTRYQVRQASHQPIANALTTMVTQKKGNYLFFFPSYQYLESIYQEFVEKNPTVETVVQGRVMDEQQRELFLQKFKNRPESNLVGFCVLGGIFSEGIDLKGERLIGVAIVGVGLAQLNAEADLVQKYYQTENHEGYQFAYQIPGMNKVLQAAGRVIRSETDIGVVLLLDQRFNARRYRELFPEHWQQIESVNNDRELKSQLMRFWK